MGVSGPLYCLCEKAETGCTNCLPGAKAAWEELQAKFFYLNSLQLLLEAIRLRDHQALWGGLETWGTVPKDQFYPLKGEAELSVLFYALESGALTSLRLCLARIGDPAAHLPKGRPWKWVQRTSRENLIAFLEHPPARINATDPQGRSLIHEIMSGNSAFAHLSLLRQYPELVMDSPDKEGGTPFYHAIQNRQHEAARMLLEMGADPNPRNRYNHWTPLMLAVRNRDAEAIALLLESDALGINHQDQIGRTALFLALSYRFVDIAQILLTDSRTDVNIKTHLGISPLHEAARLGLVDGINAILEHGACRINIVDFRRRTPLYWAAVSGKAAAVKKLLDVPGVNPAIKARPTYKTALEQAENLKFHHILSLFSTINPDAWKDEIDPEDHFVESIALDEPPSRIQMIPEGGKGI